ncbi:unnamed protein product [Toxocara canis]|uniref:AAA_12 domain-containing protein n=1 Tax=Toxocara canis TaxID=6265 RepID=A0A183UUN8_TOXCA|nr:unnamed protein product [Toxocara canis]
MSGADKLDDVQFVNVELRCGSLKRACVVTSLRDDIRWLSSTSGEGQQLAPNREFNMIISDEYDGFAQFQSLLKIGQRFKRDPTTWPQDELPFGMTHANFIGKTMHQIAREDLVAAGLIEVITKACRLYCRQIYGAVTPG